MPIYEYECEKCHETFELLQSIHDAPVSKCPHCSGKVRRIVSPPAIHFRGSGFHVTDYGLSQKSASSEKSPEKKETKETKPSKETKKEPPASKP